MKPEKHIKQDINFLDKPLWFQNVRQNGASFKWEDGSGYIYRSGYKPPDKVDIIILLYLLMQSQKANYSIKVESTRCQILKKCGLPFTNPNYYKRLEDSLKRWKNVSIEFQGTFYDGAEYLTKNFAIVDNAEIRLKDKMVVVKFNEDWLFKIRESGYFKYINFYQYRELKRPLSRRLFEILCKSFAGRDTWKIQAVKLGKKLAITGEKTKQGRVLYASKILVKIKPAIKEINNLANLQDIERLGISPMDRFSITYEVTGQKQERVIIFTRHPVNAENPEQQKDNAEIKQLIEMLRRKSKMVLVAIRQYYYKQGFKYVYRNIRYSNEHANRNYAAYIKKALRDDWAKEHEEGKEPTAKHHGKLSTAFRARKREHT